MNVLIITGPPYAGKGTQCAILKKELKYKHISTGDRIRNEKKRKSEIGLVMKDYDDKGLLVPDTIMARLLDQIIQEHQNETGIILDGYPRTIPQVETLVELLDKYNKQINQVINIKVPKEELLNRAKERAKSSTRKDDKDEAIHTRRIAVFEQNTLPAIEHLRTKTTVEDINGLGTIEETAVEIKKKLIC